MVFCDHCKSIQSYSDLQPLLNDEIYINLFQGCRHQGRCYLHGTRAYQIGEYQSLFSVFIVHTKYFMCMGDSGPQYKTTLSTTIIKTQTEGHFFSSTVLETYRICAMVHYSMMANILILQRHFVMFLLSVDRILNFLTRIRDLY